jgi:acetyl-CoA carboxylase alpha subunit
MIRTSWSRSNHNQRSRSLKQYLGMLQACLNVYSKSASELITIHEYVHLCREDERPSNTEYVRREAEPRYSFQGPSPE